MIAGFKVFKEKSRNRSELLNEEFTYLIMYCVFVFTDFVPSVEVKFFLGYLFSGFILIHLVLNIGLICTRNFTLTTRRFILKKALKKSLEKRREWRESLPEPYCEVIARRRKRWKAELEKRLNKEEAMRRT